MSLPEQPSSYAAGQKGKTGWRRILNAAIYSRDGLIAAYRHETAFRQLVWLHAVLLVLLAVAGFSLPVSMILLVASFFSLVVELVNTGLEALTDRVSTEKHPLSKIAKDVGSAAQMLALVLLALLWGLALWQTYA